MNFDKNLFVVDSNKKLQKDEILKIDNLKVNFKIKDGILQAVRGVSLTVRRGQIVGIVGESGSGKSVCVKSLIGFNDNATIEADSLNLCDIDLTKLKKRSWTFIRGSYVSYIPQDPLMSLNPTKKIGSQVAEAVLVSEHRKFIQQKKLLSKKDPEYINKLNSYKKAYKEAKKPENVKKKVIEILNFIGIKDSESRMHSYPHEFSGGMRQRIVIAIAVATRPDLIIADEPTTALDVTIQAKVLDLIKKLRDEFNITIIFISHNIALVANFCDYIYVMYAGKILEQGKTEEIFLNPQHPYTWALISSIPNENAKNEKLIAIPGTPPNLVSPPKGDAFASRNRYAMKIDFEYEPPLFDITNTHKAATWLLHPDSPKIDIPEEVQMKIEQSRSSFKLYIEKKKTEETQRLNNATNNLTNNSNDDISLENNKQGN
ncbi:ABC transporter ATP-binding protein [Mycoplasmoides pirum]|uniref:ABC transporter ATP-binding protein n=1 Tax=Mycoplasmoides pirum TaxID=2122 RepID=UPI0009DFCBEB|nr:ABC transporter ATP-binding protein [Mycoplasmoides pirum]